MPVENNLFRLVYLKLKTFYNRVSKLYTSLVVRHPLSSIICYLLLVISLSLGLFQASLNVDNENLTMLRDSEAKADGREIDRRFPFNQHERYFQHKLTSFGHYVEIMIKLKPQYNNLINQTILNQFNIFYDELISLSISV